jgi:hypothetical protein
MAGRIIPKYVSVHGFLNNWSLEGMIEGHTSLGVGSRTCRSKEGYETEQ